MVISGLTLVVVLAALYTVLGIGMNMSALTMTRMAIEMPGMAMQQMAWSTSYAVLVFLMWWLMMIALMTPSAAPMVLMHAAVGRKQTPVRPLVATALFVIGYLVVWAGFSLMATTLQWGLGSMDIVSGMMTIASPAIAGLVLIAAGLYQLTPLKEACLKHCQHPLIFIVHHWRPGRVGAFRMGIEHGRYCVGCCWFLTALLFVGGIMNLIWIAGIAIYVGIEKFTAGRRWLRIASGVALTTAGVLIVAGSLFDA